MCEEVVASVVLFGSDEEQHWAQFLFAEAGPEEDYLVLEVATGQDPEDVKLGLDGVYVERAGLGRSCYRGIARVALERDRLEIAFNDAGRACMGTDTLAVRFRLPAERFQELSAVLCRLLEEACVEVVGSEVR